jgi:hypothetical protein
MSMHRKRGYNNTTLHITGDHEQSIDMKESSVVQGYALRMTPWYIAQLHKSNAGYNFGVR